MADWAKPLFNRYDPYVIKGKLDEYITEQLNSTYKCKQTFGYSNTRLAIGAVATLFTIICHVYEYIFDAHFPKDFVITAICVVGYFAMNFLYQIYEYYYEKETFYSGAPGIPGIKSIDISSTIKRFDEFYQVKLFIYDEKGKRREIESKNSVGRFFSEDGYLVKNNTQDLINLLWKEVNKKTT